mmetsp:Transcript_39871/g.80526  ORF Transcript_39871/g.80526 Transcript_39871/m.80526 type:complete len:266 (+) Transcript_39871:71-868(+)
MGRGTAALAFASGAYFLQALPSPGQLFVPGASPRVSLRARPAPVDARGRAARPSPLRTQPACRAFSGFEVPELSALVLLPALIAMASWARPSSPQASRSRHQHLSQRRRLAGLAAAAALAAAVRPEPARAETGWRELVDQYEPEHPPVRSKSSDADLALAKHLASVGATCYAAWWDRESQDQREVFGVEAAKIAPFFECSKENRRQKTECRKVLIGEYPTWIINGKKVIGTQTMASLADLTGFTEFPKEAFQTRRLSDTNYIWGD